MYPPNTAQPVVYGDPLALHIVESAIVVLNIAIIIAYG
jgi:hypothetical protein